MTSRTVGSALLAAFSVTTLVVAACGSEPPVSEPAGATDALDVLEPIPATALPGAPADPVELDADAISVGAVEPGRRSPSTSRVVRRWETCSAPGRCR